jgi:hypothetical protein
MAERTQRAIIACGKWLSECLRLGWSRDQLDALEALWWQHHDNQGRLIQPAPDGVRGTSNDQQRGNDGR